MLTATGATIRPEGQSQFCVDSDQMSLLVVWSMRRFCRRAHTNYGMIRLFEAREKFSSPPCRHDAIFVPYVS